jgi:hypothetical protein
MAKSFNHWLTSDIKLHVDSVGCYDATHAYQGTLIDSDFYPSRAAARREAVKILREMKEDAEITETYGEW